MENLFNVEFLKTYFKIESNRGHNIAFKSCKKPIARKNGLLHDRLWNDHYLGKIAIYFNPARKSVCYWCSLDFDVKDKGQVLEICDLNNCNWWHPSILRRCLNKIGLNENNYLFVLVGRGFHLHFFFNEAISSDIAYDFLVTVRIFFENEFYKATGVMPKWNIELRPDKPIKAKACIQLPGYNFTAKRFSVPFVINNRGEVKKISALPQIDKIPINRVVYIITEFGNN